MGHEALPPLTHRAHRAERHGRWGSGAARAAVFGMSDGLVSNLSLVAGVAGASATRSNVLIGGFAGLTAGALSMAIGEYVSVAANRELLSRELAVERAEIESDPQGERDELAAIYTNRGVDSEVAMSMAGELMRNPQLALETHAREELGIDPNELGSPVKASASSFGAFVLGAFVPLIAWLFMEGAAAIWVSLACGIVAAAGLGYVLARLTRRPPWRPMARQVGFLIAAFAITSAIGSLVGAAV